MAKRKLFIVKPDPPTGVCERCSAHFTGDNIPAQFDAHECKPLESSQNALRIVRDRK